MKISAKKQRQVEEEVASEGSASRPARFGVFDGNASGQQSPAPTEARRRGPDDQPRVATHPLALKQCQVLQANLWLRYPENLTKVTVFIGATAGCGATTVSSNFAVSLAQNDGANVLLVSFNQGTSKYASTDKPAPDLSQLLDWTCTVQAPGSGPLLNLHAIPSANAASVSLSLFQSESFDQFLHAARQRFDHVIIDAPPLQGHPESLILSRKADGVLLVIDSGRTRKQTALWTKRQIEEAGGNLLGVVLNRRKYYIPRWLYNRV